ncbi:MAG: T9SS type A sorting domain-containing protein [Bacteroidales bacterium]|nr:T9SS type A sorting domain-containing protein [Bacteroidales bacterium]
MKKLTFLCVAVMVTAALIFKAENSFSQVYQLENAGFEEWNDSNGEPDGWNSFPSANCSLSVGCGTATQTRHEQAPGRPGSTGNYSCKIFATEVNIIINTITANGALTSGQIQIASSTASNVNNCNQTKTTNPDFNHHLNAKPDSIVFWAKVENANDNSEACCHLYIHDNYDLKDPLAANANGYESHIVGAVPAYNFPNNGSTWQRHSTPIIYEGYTNNDPQFVLITFSTNKNAGSGSANDALYIDDIEFIYNPIYNEFTETACGLYTWDGTEYTESGDYTKTYTVGPRDSVVTLHLTINQPVANEFSATACGNYTWNEQTYTESDDYNQTFTAANGCDSVVTLHLTINQPVSNEINETACGIFTWNEQSYTESNDYNQTFTAANGCDSVVTLHLTITEAPSREENVTAEQCNGSYTWYNVEYTEEGTYYHTVPSTNPEVCDSIITLHLTINHPVTNEITTSACNNYQWNDSIYNESGDFTQTFTAANGCDSVVTLHLTINQPIANEFSATACGNYTWNEQTYTESDDYNQTFTAANGCDSVVTLHLTIIEAPSREENVTACDSYTWYEEVYTESNDYYHTIPATEPEECDSLITLHLTINNSVTNEITETAEDSFSWNNETYTTSGNYVQTLTAANDCDSVVTLHLTITTVGIDENEMSEINVYPIPAKDVINIEGEGIKSVKVCDIVGKEIAEYNNDSEATMSISVDKFKSGSYLLVIKDENGNTVTRRISIMK